MDGEVSQGVLRIYNGKDMSKASEAALKAYPVEMTPLNYQDLIDQFGGKTEIDVNTYPRCLFQMGYEFAEKDLGWHSVDESLPPVDEEVIVLTDALNLHCFHKIGFAHIVNQEATVGIDGKPYKPISHDGWNIPAVKYWMPMPKLKEEER